MKSPWEPPTLNETMMEAEFNHLDHATWARDLSRPSNLRAVSAWQKARFAALSPHQKFPFPA
jgi:hypothetical protein